MGPRSKHRNLDLVFLGELEPQGPQDTATVAAEPKCQAFHTEVGGILDPGQQVSPQLWEEASWGGESPVMKVTSVPSTQ